MAASKDSLHKVHMKTACWSRMAGMSKEQSVMAAYTKLMFCSKAVSTVWQSSN